MTLFVVTCGRSILRQGPIGVFKHLRKGEREPKQKAASTRRPNTKNQAQTTTHQHHDQKGKEKEKEKEREKEEEEKMQKKKNKKRKKSKLFIYTEKPVIAWKQSQKLALVRQTKWK